MTADTNNKIQIIITFNSQSITFNTKREKPLVKVFSTFADRLNMEENELRYLFNGQRIRPEQTPDELGMEDGDDIQAAVMQQGGGYDLLAFGW